jgi:CheY-like chemotaxis protein
VAPVGPSESPSEKRAILGPGRPKPRLTLLGRRASYTVCGRWTPRKSKRGNRMAGMDFAAQNKKRQGGRQCDTEGLCGGGTMTDERATSTEGEGRFRILVVDDNRDGADSMALLLRLWGYDVLAVYDGAEAIEAARDYRPDCVLSDIGMPKIDGYSLAERFRQQESFKGVTLIAITAYSDTRRAMAAGFDHHFVKPADPLKLEEILRSVLKVEQRLQRVEEVAQQQLGVVGEVKELVQEVKEDVKEIKEGLQEEVKELKQELQEVKEDVKEIKEELRQKEGQE